MDFISRLPPEILGEILYHCSRLCPDAPLFLSTVSHSFHHVTRTTPLAWTNLQLPFACDQMDAACVRKADLWFSLSGTCSVDVVVDLSCVSPISVPTPLSILVNTLGKDLKFPILLPLTLHRRLERIGSLALHAATDRVAHDFLSAVCGNNHCPNNACAVQNLTLEIARELSSVASVMNDATPASPDPARPISLPHFPSLRHLQITNHALPYLHAAGLDELESLIVTGSLRASPQMPHMILNILRGTRKLVRLEFESRLLHDDTPTSLYMHSRITEDADQGVAVSSSFPNHNATHICAWRRDTLIALLNLKYLYLRTNNIPSILSRLVLPELHTLRIDDLDGRRPGAAHETGTMLRQVLVRMELPNEGRKRVGVGLRVLELVSVSLNENRGTSAIASLDQAETRSERTGNGVWGWCFKRMKTLKRLKASNVDMDALFGLLLQGFNLRSSAEALDDLACPRLESLSIPSACASWGALKDFRMRRSSVAVILKGNQRERKRSRLNLFGSLHDATSNSGGPTPFNSELANQVPLLRSDGEGVGSPLHITETTAGLGGFGFGSTFDRLRNTAGAESRKV
ncbi:hypothetical protein AX17_007044 [Amanita inopinata Kibby_2008]|nr:hypothetical protein AX17_007044 [Amanita inopinata Kibby_2008]